MYFIFGIFVNGIVLKPCQISVILTFFSTLKVFVWPMRGSFFGLVSFLGPANRFLGWLHFVWPWLCRRGAVVCPGQEGGWIRMETRKGNGTKKRKGRKQKQLNQNTKTQKLNYRQKNTIILLNSPPKYHHHHQKHIKQTPPTYYPQNTLTIKITVRKYAKIVRDAHWLRTVVCRP